MTDIALSEDENLLAVAENENKIYFYNLNKNKVVLEIETFVDYGGQRMCFANKDESLIVGAYNKSALKAYNISSGEQIWENKLVKKVQHISRNQISSDFIHVYSDTLGLVNIDVKTGKIIFKISKVRKINSFLKSQVLEKEITYEIQYSDSKKIIEVEKKSLITLDMLLYKNSFIISEMGQPLRSFNLLANNLEWEFNLPKETHFLNIYIIGNNLYCILYDFGKKENNKLYKIDPTKGLLIDVITLPVRSTRFLFSKRGNYLININLEVVSIETGQVLKIIDLAN